MRLEAHKSRFSTLSKNALLDEMKKVAGIDLMRETGDL